MQLLCYSKLFEVISCSQNAIKEIVHVNSNAIEAPFEFIYLPLLSISAHFMGPGACVNKYWNELVILWTVVLAAKRQEIASIK